MKKEVENKKVAELILKFGNANIKKLLKEMIKGQLVYKTFNDNESSFRNR
jgi:hypothetical protein